MPKKVLKSKSLAEKVINKLLPKRKKKESKKEYGLAKYGIEEYDIQNIEMSIKLIVQRRKDVYRLLKSLEGAWREAAGPNIALNRPLLGSELPQTDLRKPALIAAGSKKRKIQEFQQKLFLSFQQLTDEKGEEQIKEGKILLQELESLTKKIKKDKVKNYSKIRENSERYKTNKSDIMLSHRLKAFIDKEDKINRGFLKKMGTLTKSIAPLLKETQTLKRLPCDDQSFNKLLNKDIKVLEDFLLSTKTMLKK